MPSPPTPQQVKAFLTAAFECSYYITPTAPGLTHDELNEAARRLGLQPGEVWDALNEVADVYMGMRADERLLPKRTGILIHWPYFIAREEPEYRDIKAFDFVYEQLRDSARANGARAVRLERSMVVERAVQSGIKRLAIETTVAILVFSEILKEENGILTPVSLGPVTSLPSENLKQNNIPQTRQDAARKAAYPIVQDILARRHDGRLPAVEPLDAFASMLAELGYGPFRLWWQQMVTEVRLTDPQVQATSSTVLSAALVEGALTFVVRHARKLGQGVMGSKTFDEPPHRWRIEDLISGASSGREQAILDENARRRAELLVKTRQRIHAGRLLTDYPGGPPDLRPDEARDAKATADLVVRRVLDWLDRNPL